MRILTLLFLLVLFQEAYSQQEHVYSKNLRIITEDHRMRICFSNTSMKPMWIMIFNPKGDRNFNKRIRRDIVDVKLDLDFQEAAEGYYRVVVCSKYEQHMVWYMKDKNKFSYLFSK